MSGSPAAMHARTASERSSPAVLSCGGSPAASRAASRAARMRAASASMRADVRLSIRAFALGLPRRVWAVMVWHVSHVRRARVKRKLDRAGARLRDVEPAGQRATAGAALGARRAPRLQVPMRQPRAEVCREPERLVCGRDSSPIALDRYQCSATGRNSHEARRGDIPPWRARSAVRAESVAEHALTRVDHDEHGLRALRDVDHSHLRFFFLRGAGGGRTRVQAQRRPLTRGSSSARSRGSPWRAPSTTRRRPASSSRTP